jgi:hypothetical protein
MRKGKLPAYSRQAIDVTFSPTSDMFYSKTVQCLVTNVGLLPLTLNGQGGRESSKSSIQEVAHKAESVRHIAELDNGGKISLSEATLDFGFVEMSDDKFPKLTHLVNSSDQALKISFGYDKSGSLYLYERYS